MLRILQGQTVISGVKVPVMGLGSAWTLSCFKREPTLFGHVISREDIKPRNAEWSELQKEPHTYICMKSLMFKLNSKSQL